MEQAAPPRSPGAVTGDTSGVEPRPRVDRLLVLVLCLMVGLGLLAGCGEAPVDQGPLAGPTTAAAAATRTEEQQVLDERARAVRTHDRALFMRHVARSDPAFVARQRRSYDALTQLPLRTLSYTVLDKAWPEPLMDPVWGQNATLPQVEVRTQLAGFDAVPVLQTTGLAFARRGGQVLLVDDRTRGGSVFPGSAPAPWDLARVHVLDDGNVLGVFGDSSWPQARTLVDAVQQGVGSVTGILPFGWSGRVVLYSFANRDVLDALQDVPGGNITHLGALTFPLYADAGRQERAGTRFALLPSSVAAGQPFLGRIIRHELSHVAIGARDDGDPTWVSEGIAEYIGARDLPLAQRQIPTVAVAAAASVAQDGGSGMPASADFNGPDQAWHYALSWMACDYLAATQSEATLWELLAALHDGGHGTSDADQDSVLVRLTGLDSHQLAQRAAQRIQQLYG